MRQSQLTGRLRLARLQELTEAADDEMGLERHRFARLADPQAAPRVVSSFNLFQTPPDLAARLAGMFDHIGRTLEPSAGLGRLYKALRAVSPACPVVLVEQSAECCGELYRATEADNNCRLVQGDFLACNDLGLFDSILMNPPFKMGTDVKHIRHAATMLAPGGRLVALCANGPKQRAGLQPIATTWTELPPSTFASEGTRVAAAIVTIDA